MQFPKRRISELEYSLRVLWCVDALRMATLDQLWPFMARLDLIEYMPLCERVDELLKSGALALGEHAMERMLYLTDQGREYLRLFEQRMPATDRERVRELAPAYQKQMTISRQLNTAYELAKPGEYRVLCTFREGDVPTLILRVVTRDRGLARHAARGFEDAAGALLVALYGVPPCKSAPQYPVYTDQQQALDAAAPGKPALCAYGKHEHLSVVWLGCDSADYEAALLTPSADAARAWACAALKAGEVLARRLTEALRGAAPVKER